MTWNLCQYLLKLLIPDDTKSGTWWRTIRIPSGSRVIKAKSDVSHVSYLIVMSMRSDSLAGH